VVECWQRRLQLLIKFTPNFNRKRYSRVNDTPTWHSLN